MENFNTSVTFDAVNLYSSETSTRRSKTITGVYYFNVNDIKNDSKRVEVADASGNVVGWVNKSSIEEVVKDAVDQISENNEDHPVNDLDDKTGIVELHTSDDEIVSEPNEVVENVDKCENNCDEYKEVEKDNEEVASPKFELNDEVKILGNARWSTGGRVPLWTKVRKLYVKSVPDSNGFCTIGNSKTGGNFLGSIHTKYLTKA